MRCFISISKNVTNKHLSILQIFVIGFTVIYTPLIMVIKVYHLLFKLLLAILIGAIMGNSFMYLFYLVFCYMKDSKLGPEAMMLVKDQLKSAKIHFGLFMLTFSVAAGSMMIYFIYFLSGDQSWKFLLLSIHYSSAGAGLFSMSFLAAYAVQVTQVSIKSRRKLFT
jgi:hypothetical protein